MRQYIVDAFTNKPFSGNPAAVCVMDEWPSEESMMKLAMENNLSETNGRIAISGEATLVAISDIKVSL